MAETDRPTPARRPVGPTDEDQRCKQHWRRVLEADRTRLLVAQPFTAALALQLDLVPVVDSRLTTAATDGQSLYANVRFLAALDDTTRLFVLAHEVWHCVAGHLVRRLGRDPLRWNLAVDHEVNALLKNDGFPLPGDAVYFRELDGQSAEAVYAHLSAGLASHPTRVQFDDHAPWETLTTADGSDATAVWDPDFVPIPGTPELVRAWLERAVGVAQQLESRGDLPRGVQVWLQARMAPTLPWPLLMRQFVQRTCGGTRRWTPPSRRHLYRQLWLPGTRGESLRLMLAVDTSGSTRGCWSQFMAEVEALMGDFDRIELTLVECDAAISRVRDLCREDIGRIAREGLTGGGGTDLRPPFELAARNPPSCLVYLTDGEGPAPATAPGFPVLWVLAGDSPAPVHWGEMVRINRRRGKWAR